MFCAREMMQEEIPLQEKYPLSLQLNQLFEMDGVKNKGKGFRDANVQKQQFSHFLGKDFYDRNVTEKKRLLLEGKEIPNFEDDGVEKYVVKDLDDWIEQSKKLSEKCHREINREKKLQEAEKKRRSGIQKDSKSNNGSNYNAFSRETSNPNIIGNTQKVLVGDNTSVGISETNFQTLALKKTQSQSTSYPKSKITP